VVANSALRAATIGIKAVLIIALAVWLDPADLGAYGLIAATITLTTYLYGLDFYTFTLREISAGNLGAVRYQIRDQFLLFGAIYGLGTMVLLLLLPRLSLDPALAAMATAIAVLQHASLEFYRVLVRIERTLEASICFLIRDAAWVPACLALWLARGDISLLEVLMFWLAGSAASVGFAIWSLSRLLPLAPAPPVDLVWLGRGVRTGLRMLPGTLSLRALFTVDRMILAVLAPPQVLGAYVFFVSLCAAAQALFETGILPFFWPRLLEAARQGNAPARATAERQLARVCLVGAPAIALASVAAGVVLAGLLPNPAYEQNLELLFFVAAAYMLMTLSNAPHYGLYADGRDIAIVISNALAFAAFLAVAGLLALAGSGLAVPLALVLACLLLALLKRFMARRAA
jgi:O-antigen/teichoic acid export membrane protein